MDRGGAGTRHTDTAGMLVAGARFKNRRVSRSEAPAAAVVRFSGVQTRRRVNRVKVVRRILEVIGWSVGMFVLLSDWPV